MNLASEIRPDQLEGMTPKQKKNLTNKVADLILNEIGSRRREVHKSEPVEIKPLSDDWYKD